MKYLEINSHNILENPWVFDFFSDQIEKKQSIWEANKKFQFHEKKFKFLETVFVRERKNKDSGYAFEMLSKTLLGIGVCAEVYRIACTISRDKNGEYSVKNKKRVVKMQEIAFSKGEYNITKLVPHLNVKRPNYKGWMVMREMEGESLQSFLEKKQQFLAWNYSI